MKHSALLMFTLTVVMAIVSNGCKQPGTRAAVVRQPYTDSDALAPVKIAEDLYDTTQRWQSLFGLDGRLEISEARRDARAAPEDGSIDSHFRAVPKKPGWYTFVFVCINAFGPYQVHAVRLVVVEGAQNIKTPFVSPDSEYSMFQPIVAPGTPVIVHWSFYPGGEGPIGGWQLVGVTYSPVAKASRRLGIPGFYYDKGE